MDVSYRGESLKGEEHTFTLQVSEEDVERWARRWEAEQRKRNAEIAAAMKACPHVACTCGYHED